MRVSKGMMVAGMAALLIAQSVFAVGANIGRTRLKPPGNKDLFVLKVDRKWIGAAVSIIGEHGRELSSQVLPKRKMIIDFSDLKDGEYKIVVVKGSSKKEFVYDKK